MSRADQTRRRNGCGRSCPNLRLITLLPVLFVAVQTGAFAQGGQQAPAPPVLERDAPGSVILFVGDGMGAEHLRAAEAIRDRVRLEESFAHQADVITTNDGGSITDSAAAATAMATGRKVRNRVIAQARPGNRHDLATVADSYVAGGRSFGIVTTSELTHATPAAFAAHARSRNARSEIATDYLSESRPDLMIGGGGAGLTPEMARAAGYEVFSGLRELPSISALDPYRSDAPKSVIIGDGHMPYVIDASGADARPALGEMVVSALELLSGDPDGFFLLVEAARIDHASHDHDIERAMAETGDLLDAVDSARDWLDRRGLNDTLVIVTADHETGGLSIEGPVRSGVVPEVSWSTGGHTDARVPAFASGPNADRVVGVLENTDLYDIMMGR